VNAKGLRQISEKALEPQGASKPGWQQVADLAAALGYEPSWNRLKQIRARLAGSTAVDGPLAQPPVAVAGE